MKAKSITFLIAIKVIIEELKLNLIYLIKNFKKMKAQAVFILLFDFLKGKSFNKWI